MPREAQPLVTVIMPVYNTPINLLERAVGSVLAQDVRAVELLLVDDGSRAECAEACDKLAAADARARVIHQANAGVSAARNAALDVARGVWIMFVDSDDELLPGTLGRGVQLASENSLDILYAEVVDCEGSRRKTRKLGLAEPGGLAIREGAEFTRALETYFISYETMDQSTVPRALSIGPVSRLYRAETLDRSRFDARLRIMEDALFNSIVASNAERVGFLCEPWYAYHKHNDSAVHSMSFAEDSRIHCEVMRRSVIDRSLPMDAYYSQVCTYFFFVLHSLSVAGMLSYRELKRGYNLPWFREAFAELDRSGFDYPTAFERLKYRLGTSGKVRMLFVVFVVRRMLKTLAWKAR